MVTTLPSAEETARRTLRLGAIALVGGIGLVGVGYDQIGGVPVLAGLAVTIFGIHVYGRLGPDDEPAPFGKRALEARRAEANGLFWRGLFVALAGLAVTLGPYVADAPHPERSWGSYLVCLGAIAGGMIQLARGRAKLEEAARAQARVEKKRRLSNRKAP